MTDKDLKGNVQGALEWEPSINAADIGVTVDHGVVTLHATVNSYAHKMTAERVTLRVWGVRAIANDLVVQLPTDFTRNDSEIAQAALNALKWNIHVPADRLSLCGGVPAAGNFASRWC